jgi:hypothetical protein
MSPLNAAICTTTYLERQKCYGPDKKILFEKPLFDLEVKGQRPTKAITVRDTPPYGHAPTYQISLTYLVCVMGAINFASILCFDFWSYDNKYTERHWLWRSRGQSTEMYA